MRAAARPSVHVKLSQASGLLALLQRSVSNPAVAGKPDVAARYAQQLAATAQEIAHVLAPSSEPRR